MIVEVFVDDTQMREKTADESICRSNEQVCRKQHHSRQKERLWMGH